MAYVDQPGQTEQDKANQQSPLNQPPTTGAAVGSAGAGDKTPNQPSSSVAPAPFTNLGSYLSVNAPQIQGMAEKVSGQLGQTYDTAKGAVDTGAAAIQNQITGGYAAPNQQLVSQAAANPTEFAANPENVAAFQAQYGNKYTGPASAEVTPDYATTQGTVQKAVNDAANLGNYGGLQSYLTTNLETNPTQAMSALDTALLNQRPEAISQINTQTARFPSLTEYLNQAVAQQNQNIANAQSAAQTGAQAAQNQFVGQGGVLPTFQADLAQRLASAQSTGAAENKRIQETISNLGSGTATEAQIQDLKNTLGIPGMSTYDLTQSLGILKGTYGKPFDLTGYLTSLSPEAEYTQANIATPADYAKAAALKQLIGGDYTGGINPDEAALAGTAPKTLSQFDYMKAQTDTAEAVRQRDQDTLTNFPVGYSGDDPKTIAMLQDVYTRHANLLNNNQKMWLQNNPPEGGTKGTPPDLTKPPAEGASRVVIVTNPQTGIPEQKWWDGSAWVKAPSEYKHEKLADGSTKNWKFDFNTGKYSELPTTPPGKTPPGVVVAF